MASICNWLCPSLENAGSCALFLRKTSADAAKAVSIVLLAAASGTALVSFRCLRENSFSLPVALAFAGGSSIALLSGLSFRKLRRYTDRIGKIQNAAELSFEELCRCNLLHRVGTKALQKKFAQMAKKLDAKGFLLLSKECDFPSLAIKKIASIAECRFEKYGVDLKKIKSKEIPAAFPLRKEAFQGPIPEFLQKEADRQQELCEKIRTLAAKYPKRNVNSSEVGIWCVQNNMGFEAVDEIENQRTGYMRELTKLLAGNGSDHHHVGSSTNSKRRAGRHND